MVTTLPYAAVRPAAACWRGDPEACGGSSWIPAERLDRRDRRERWRGGSGGPRCSPAGARARVLERVGHGRARLDQRWQADDDVCRGWRAGASGSGGRLGVRGFDAGASLLEFGSNRARVGKGRDDRDRGGAGGAGHRGALITGTAGDRPLPPSRCAGDDTRHERAVDAIGGGGGASSHGGWAICSIGTSARGSVRASTFRKPEPVDRIVVEVDERMGADGRAVRVPDPGGAGSGRSRGAGAGHRLCGGGVLHGDQNDARQRAAAEVLRTVGFRVVRTSTRCRRS